MLGWLLIAAFFASLLWVGLDAAIEPADRWRPFRLAAACVANGFRAIFAAVGAAVSAGARLLSRHRRSAPDATPRGTRCYADVLIDQARERYVRDQISISVFEADVAQWLRHPHAETDYDLIKYVAMLERARAASQAERKAEAERAAQNEAAETERKRLAAAASFVRD